MALGCAEEPTLHALPVERNRHEASDACTQGCVELVGEGAIEREERPVDADVDRSGEDDPLGPRFKLRAYLRLRTRLRLRLRNAGAHRAGHLRSAAVDMKGRTGGG